MAKDTPLADRIWAMIEEVRDDIRQKVVEEPWFGRPVTEKLADIHASLDQAQEQTARPEKEQDVARFYGREQPEPPAPEQGPDRSRGMER